MTQWSIGDVLEYVEHPERRVRVREPDGPENAPFRKITRLGALLNKFSPEDQEMYFDNFVDTIEQAHDDLFAGD